MYYILGALALFFGEGKIKKWVESHFSPGEERAFWNDGLILTLHHNAGFAGNRQSKNRKLVLGVSVTGIFLVVINAAYTFLGKFGHILKSGMMLLLAGGLSNAYDRLQRGYVVDYFIINKGCLKKTIFNLADIFLFAGVLLCTFGSFRKGD